MTDEAASTSPGPNVATTLAFERTRVAYERTMMSWVRTATALITFGFSVYKFFQLETVAKGPAAQIVGSREFALALIGSGILSLLLGTLEHMRDLKALRDQYPGMRRSGTSVATILIAALGVLAFLAVVFRS
jgi:inner membrane protein YidH